MIQIQPFSFISSMSLYFIALYLRTIHQLFKIKLQLTLVNSLLVEQQLQKLALQHNQQRDNQSTCCQQMMEHLKSRV